MAELHESSGLLSLAALRKHEEKRSVQQAEEARAHAEAEQRARASAERERGRLARERAELEESVQRAIDATRHAESVELERARLAEFERAESEAHSRRALELSLAEERSARRGAEVAFLARAARQRFLSVASSTLCLVTWLAGAVLYGGVIRPDAARTRATFERSLANEQRARVEAEASGVRATQRAAALSERVSALEQASRDDRTTSLPAPAAHGPSKKSGQSLRGDTGSRKRCVDNGDGDPLNPCLKP
ncbi:MAG TPA: hypothetical protein VNW92_06440 [Polyangiaceae bacterium]|jgi:hypothetical protein|nr:hypothetical protein [Polyangiaceae bacterium]